MTPMPTVVTRTPGVGDLVVLSPRWGQRGYDRVLRVERLSYEPNGDLYYQLIIGDNAATSTILWVHSSDVSPVLPMWNYHQGTL